MGGRWGGEMGWEEKSLFKRVKDDQMQEFAL